MGEEKKRGREKYREFMEERIGEGEWSVVNEVERDEEWVEGQWVGTIWEREIGGRSVGAYKGERRGKRGRRMCGGVTRRGIKRGENIRGGKVCGLQA